MTLELDKNNTELNLNKLNLPRLGREKLDETLLADVSRETIKDLAEKRTESFLYETEKRGARILHELEKAGKKLTVSPEVAEAIAKQERWIQHLKGFVDTIAPTSLALHRRIVKAQSPGPILRDLKGFVEEHAPDGIKKGMLNKITTIQDTFDVYFQAALEYSALLHSPNKNDAYMVTGALRALGWERKKLAKEVGLTPKKLERTHDEGGIELRVASILAREFSAGSITRACSQIAVGQKELAQVAQRGKNYGIFGETEVEEIIASERKESQSQQVIQGVHSQLPEVVERLSKATNDWLAKERKGVYEDVLAEIKRDRVEKKSLSTDSKEQVAKDVNEYLKTQEGLILKAIVQSTDEYHQPNSESDIREVVSAAGGDQAAFETALRLQKAGVISTESFQEFTEKHLVVEEASGEGVELKREMLRDYTDNEDFLKELSYTLSISGVNRIINTLERFQKDEGESIMRSFLEYNEELLRDPDKLQCGVGRYRRQLQAIFRE